MSLLSSYLILIANTSQDVNVTYNISFQANGTFESQIPRNNSFVVEYSSKYGNSSASIEHNGGMDWIYNINNKYYICRCCPINNCFFLCSTISKNIKSLGMHTGLR